VLQAISIGYSNGWSPFKVATKADLVRPMQKLGGVEDRLRIVAFAEVQARDAFMWGAEHFKDAPQEWKEVWTSFAKVENRHAQMLLDRFFELGFALEARAVSEKLTKLCRASTDPITFLFLLASAEERGMEAGHILGKQMQSVDPISAKLFLQIADEEQEHVAHSKKILQDFDINELRERAKIVDQSLGV
jgi:rubrerythrin